MEHGVANERIIKEDQSTIPSPTPWYIVPNVYLREYFAVVKSLIFDW